MSNLKTIREVKIDAVKAEIEALEKPHDDEEGTNVYIKKLSV
jgi:CRISPR/Cas system CMR-associated protein Cmr1 (group 7 of RAMP superfamily)